MSQKMVQIRLETVTEPKAIMVTWVEQEPRLRENIEVSLKDDDRRWRITNIFDTIVVDKVLLDMNRNWDNNNYDKHNGTPIKDRK